MKYRIPYVLLGLLALAACGREPMPPVQLFSDSGAAISSPPLQGATEEAALPDCSWIKRDGGSTRESGGDLRHEGRHPKSTQVVDCWEKQGTQWVIRKMELTSWSSLPNRLSARTEDPRAVPPDHPWLSPMSKHVRRAELNAMSLVQLAEVFGNSDKAREYIQIPDIGKPGEPGYVSGVDRLVQHYESVTGKNFGHTGEGFAAVLRSSRVKLLACNSKFLTEHDLTGFTVRDGKVEFHNVGTFTHMPRRICDPGEQTICIDGIYVAMTGCLNGVVVLGRPVENDAIS